ncbi:hypothetical protein GQX73_g3068 [Xylaria multiplex]|uniref:5'-3' DNA helicase ZGRF1-like N-terminal domain-containing protein n=1 Tax=Xylaria multiplex TaxID=323545 RepID=A0A7C8J4H0_9PEZI|nr:hypothetical protein GQX73_g3068 [Xylaria multiplex]
MVTTIWIMQSSTLTTYAQSSATTAPVREHACLFTHDLRRKQKRWQDGRLKYHTFNRRVMVYDERGNFVGDTHWREDYDLADGDDLELERGGIIIQVGECVGSRDQDLSDLVDKRAKEKAERQAAAAARRPPVTAVTPLHVIKPQSQQRKHLHDIIGTPSGHHGRAVLPQESPYEERRQKLAAPQSDDNRPAKRQRREISPLSKNGYAQNLFGATLTLSGRPSSQAPAPNRPSKQMPLQAYDAQLPTKSFARLHSSVRPEPPSYVSSSILDEPGKPPTPQKPQSAFIVGQEKDIIGRHSTIDSQSINRNSRKPREIDRSLEQADSRAGQSSEPPSLGGSKKIRDKNKKKLGASRDCAQGQKHRASNVIDLTEGQADTPKHLVHDEPRTELIIKPRKKRGLLMVSERNTKCGSSSKSESTKTGPENHSFPLSLKDQPINISTDLREEFPKEARKSALQRNKTDGDNDDDERGRHTSHQSSRLAGTKYVEDGQLGAARCVDRLNSKSQKKPKLKVIDEHDDTHTITPCVVGAKRSLRPRKRPSAEDATFSSGDDEDNRLLYSARREDSAAVDDMPAPRLANLSRKSIKSKEIIGFIFDEPDPAISVKQDGHTPEDPSLDFQPDQGINKQQHQPNNTHGSLGTVETPLNAESQSRRKRLRVVQEQRSKELRLSNDEVNPTVQTEGAPSKVTISMKQPIVSIANPATRGKKAAKPSDAAGQMPICPLPAELAESSSSHQNPRKKNVQENPDKGSANPMPGFSRANGGPWSREAHDLFDFKRPP